MSLFALLLLNAVVMVISVMLATKFLHARRGGVVFSTIAVVVGMGLGYAGYTYLGGGIFAWVVGFVLVALSFAAILQTGIGQAVGLAIISFVIQLALLGALASFAPEKTKEIAGQYLEPINGKKAVLK